MCESPARLQAAHVKHMPGSPIVLRTLGSFGFNAVVTLIPLSGVPSASVSIHMTSMTPTQGDVKPQVMKFTSVHLHVFQSLSSLVLLEVKARCGCIFVDFFSFFTLFNFFLFFFLSFIFFNIVFLSVLPVYGPNVIKQTVNQTQ